MPDLSSVNAGSFSTAAGLRSQIFVFMGVDGSAEGADMVRRAAATRADDFGAGVQKRFDPAHHLFGSFVVDHFQGDELRLAGVGLHHNRKTRYLAIAHDGLARA